MAGNECITCCSQYFNKNIKQFAALHVSRSIQQGLHSSELILYAVAGRYLNSCYASTASTLSRPACCFHSQHAACDAATLLVLVVLSAPPSLWSMSVKSLKMPTPHATTSGGRAEQQQQQQQ
jgi:hypothetical protein